ncbi:MAG: hypothetical protein WKG06_19735 [Segetibacter sp.]
MNPVNHANYIPEPSTFKDAQGVSHNFGGIMGILGAAGVVFFAFIGFDAVSTAAQEAKNPKEICLSVYWDPWLYALFYIFFLRMYLQVLQV